MTFVVIWAQLGPKIEENTSVNKKERKKESAASSHTRANEVFIRKKSPSRQQRWRQPGEVRAVYLAPLLLVAFFSFSFSFFSFSVSLLSIVFPLLLVSFAI